MKNSEIYSEKKYTELCRRKNYFLYLKFLHIYLIILIIIIAFIFGLYYNKLQSTYKLIVVAFFILHFHWDIFNECLVSYYEKKKLNKRYKLGQLMFLNPDFQHDNKNINLSSRLLIFSLNYIIPTIIAFNLIKNKTKLNCILFSFTIILHIKWIIRYYTYFKKYNVYGEEI